MEPLMAATPFHASGDDDKKYGPLPPIDWGGVMFDWRSLRGVAVAIAMLAVVLGILAALIHIDGGLIGHGMAAIGFD